jgi:glycosyltransferase involved in cell wall biosynthesis
VISVVIATHRRPQLLRCALRSLAEQTFSDFEVVVVNDGGPSVRADLAPWRNLLALTLVELPESRGPARARNIGIERAAGEHIAFLDDDDIFLPRHLAAADRALRGTGADFVYCGAVISNDRIASAPTDLSGFQFKAYPFDPEFLLVVNYIHTGSVVARNGGPAMRFDESLSLCEDWDMWIALSHRLGHRGAFVDELTTVYHQVPEVTGLVEQALESTPSPFSVVRERIYRKWPTKLARVIEYRQWFTDFEHHRNRHIAAGRPIPNRMFDHVLSRLYTGFTNGETLDRRTIPELFADLQASAAPHHRPDLRHGL